MWALGRLRGVAAFHHKRQSLDKQETQVSRQLLPWGLRETTKALPTEHVHKGS